LSVRDESDRELVRAILDSRSESAFQELFTRHSPRLYRVALRLTSDPHDAEDVLQETWLRGTKKLAWFRWESSFSTWITGIAAFVSREHLQRKRRWDGDVETPPSIIAVRPEMIDLERAIAFLPAGQRAAFILHDVEGFTHEEIAQQMSWTAGTSKSQLHRARRSLAERLADLRTGV
jgi:RNA polymerase sigma-70 factor (ECF subfamily)